MTDRRFPILPPWHLKPALEREQGVVAIVLSIPWAVLAPHEAQALANHGQSLERIAQRGGLEASEAVAIIEDRPWHRMPRKDANAALLRYLVAEVA